MTPFFGRYTAQKADALRAQPFDRTAIAGRGLKYERLDQLTIDLLLGKVGARGDCLVGMGMQIDLRPGLK